MTPPTTAPGTTPRRQIDVRTRDLARDLNNGRVGEIMDSRLTSHGMRYDLRPVGGGREWTVPEESVQLLDQEAAS